MTKEKETNDYCPRCDELGDWVSQDMNGNVIVKYNCHDCDIDYEVIFIPSSKKVL